MGTQKGLDLSLKKMESAKPPTGKRRGRKRKKRQQLEQQVKQEVKQDVEQEVEEEMDQEVKQEVDVDNEDGVKPKSKWDDPLGSLHCHQSIMNPTIEYQSRSDIPFTRILSPDYPRLPYRRRKGEVKSLLHWGQRKLLMSEIEFLTRYSDPTPDSKPKRVVYAGAAPGTHVGYLAILFPWMRFELYDPARFTVRGIPGRIECHRVVFDDERAGNLAPSGDDILFVSDIRSGDYDRQTRQEADEAVLRDLRSQERWHKAIRPVKSLLKFRFPFSEVGVYAFFLSTGRPRAP